jgi:ABC-type lipoprotein release transport system permease subunit
VFLTYVYRELRRRHRQALLIALGLALGVCLVVTVSATAGGVRDAQNDVLHSLYGVGTDITVTQSAQRGSGGPQQFGMNPGGAQKQGQRFSRDAVTSTMGLALVADKKVTSIAGLRGVSAAVGGLTLSSMHMSGKFAKIVGGSSSAGGSGSGSAAAAPSTTTSGSGAPSQAPIKISSFTIAGVDVADQTIGPLSSATITTGRTFTAKEDNAAVVVVDAGYAKQNSLAVGDTMKIAGVSFKVIGVSKSASAAANVYLPLGRAQTIAGEKDKVNQIYVKATSATQIAAVKKEIKATVPGATVTTAQDLADQVSGSLASASKLADQLGTWLAIAALIAAVAVASLLTLSGVSRRVREFGTLKALGWRSRRIVSQVLGEAVVMGIAGGLGGAVLAVAATRLVGVLSPSLQATVGSSGLPTGAAQNGLSGGSSGPAGPLSSLSHTVTVYLHASVSPGLLAAAIALGLAGALVAGGLGGWRAARLSPADALRRVD